VRTNVSAFGGDPDRVTVAGESAGAMSVITLLSMPGTDGLFTQAIAQSGAAAHTLTPEQGQLVGRHLADALGVPANRDALVNIPLDILVRAASDLVEQVQTAPDPATWGRIGLNQLPFAPVVDGTVLPTAPIDAIAAGHGGRVRLMIGSNRDEARLFLVPPGIIDRIDEPSLQATAAGYGLPPHGLATYCANRPHADPGDVLAAVIGDWYYRIPAIRVADARAAHDPRNTWVYRFDHPEPAQNHGLGACHGVEIPFVFDTIARPETHPRIGDAPSQAVADTVHAAWVSFITHGAPGWTPYTPGTRTTALLTDTITEEDDPAGDERAVWDDIR
jgi:para-nitrobenzyl esterase